MNKNNITIYTPESSLRNPVHMMRKMFRDLMASRDLAWQLAMRDIKSQYRQTALGLIWAFIMPVANASAWLFIQRAGIVTMKDTSIPYPVYVFTGTIVWAIFMDAIRSPLEQTYAARPMLAKINFPREALIVSGTYQVAFNGAIKILVLFAVILFMGARPDWRIVFFPLAMLSLILAGTAFGLVITPVGMLYTDIGKGLPLLLQFLMYITPVVFPMPASGWASTLFHLNPITPLIITARNLLTGSTVAVLGSFIIVNCAMVFLLSMMWIIYRVAMPILIERMNA